MIKITKKNIVLIGMMGTFKTAAGKMLANSLDMDFADTDEIFVSSHGGIPEYFARLGEDAFRREETLIAENAASLSDTVISCGGGLPLRSENMTALKKTGTVVWIKCAPESIVSRIGGGEGRPMLKAGEASESLADKVARLCREREPIYGSYADFTIDNSYLTAQATAQLLKELFI